MISHMQTKMITEAYALNKMTRENEKGFKFKIREGCMKITPDGEKEKVRGRLLIKCDVLQLHRL